MLFQPPLRIGGGVYHCRFFLCIDGMLLSWLQTAGTPAGCWGRGSSMMSCCQKHTSTQGALRLMALPIHPTDYEGSNLLPHMYHRCPA